MSTFTQQDFYRRIYRRARNSDLFTFAEIRKELGVDGSNKKRRNRLWNWFRTLKRNDIVAAVADQGRKRNKYYQVADADALAEKLSPSVNGGSSSPSKDDEEEEAGPPSGFGLLSRLEEKVTKVAERQDDMADRLDAIESTEAELKRQVDHLVAIWS